MVDHGDVRTTNRLRLVQDEELVLAVLARELRLELNVKVGLDRV